MLFAPGAFMTTMPRAVAAGTSTLSTPVPARAITRSLGAAAMSVAVDVGGAADDERVGVREIDGEIVGGAAGCGVDGPASRRLSSSTAEAGS